MDTYGVFKCYIDIIKFKSFDTYFSFTLMLIYCNYIKQIIN